MISVSDMTLAVLEQTKIFFMLTTVMDYQKVIMEHLFCSFISCMPSSDFLKTEPLANIPT